MRRDGLNGELSLDFILPARHHNHHVRTLHLDCEAGRVSAKISSQADSGRIDE